MHENNVTAITPPRVGFTQGLHAHTAEQTWQKMYNLLSTIVINNTFEGQVLTCYTYAVT